MSYIVEKITGTYAAEPGKKNSDREKRKGKTFRKEEGHDTVQISAEARERSASEDPECEEDREA